MSWRHKPSLLARTVGPSWRSNEYKHCRRKEKDDKNRTPMGAKYFLPRVIQITFLPQPESQPARPQVALPAQPFATPCHRQNSPCSPLANYDPRRGLRVALGSRVWSGGDVGRLPLRRPGRQPVLRRERRASLLVLVAPGPAHRTPLVASQVGGRARRRRRALVRARRQGQ